MAKKQISKPIFILIIIVFSIVMILSQIPIIINVIDAFKTGFTTGLNESRISFIYEKSGAEAVIELIDQEIEERPKDVFLNNQKGIYLMELDRHDEAVECFKISYENSTDEVEQDSALNNLSWAYNRQGEFEKALEYINMALEISPNDEYEYLNKGNALFWLERYEEAIEEYLLALEKDHDFYRAMSGLGVSYFWLGQFDKSIEYLNKYLEFESQDEDIYSYVILANIYLGNYGLVYDYINKLENINSEYLDLMYYKAYYYYSLDEYEESIEYYEKYLDIFPSDYDALYEIAESLHLLGNYYESNNYIERALETYPDDISLKTLCVYNYAETGEYDKALALCDELISNGNDNYEVYNALGYVYMCKTEYKKSQEYFEKSYQLDSSFQTAYENMAYNLYWDKDYNECIKFCEYAIDIFPENWEFRWYIGDSYSALYKSEKAIEYYLETLKLIPENDYLISVIALEYWLLQDYENSSLYCEEALDLNKDNYIARSLKDKLEELEQNSDGQGVLSFFKENYLYINEIEISKNEIDKLLNNDNITGKEVEAFLSNSILEDDIYSFVIYGEDYDYLTRYSNLSSIEYTYESNDNKHYIYIKQFNYNTYSEFREIINKIENTENSTLIIDLRDNFGGLIDSANDILDTLLRSCTTSFTIDRDGYISSYNSGESSIEFNNIIIFVNENTASSSELLALGLKKFLPNVTIIGKPTFGKGVGQVVYENKKQKFLVYLVNFHWNVKETNITNTKIIPDIYVDSNNLSDYLNEVSKIK